MADGFAAEKVQHVLVLQGLVYTAQVHRNLAGSVTEVSVSVDALTLDMTSSTQSTVVTVANLDTSRHFYGKLLGCQEGRSSAHWIDFSLFGHQTVTLLRPSIVPVAGPILSMGIAFQFRISAWC